MPFIDWGMSREYTETSEISSLAFSQLLQKLEKIEKTTPAIFGELCVLIWHTLGNQMHIQVSSI